MREFRVDISRPLISTNEIHGIRVKEDSGLNYVDVYFPDGSQRVWGYIGRNPVPGSQFSPLAGCKQWLADQIQDAINDLLGCTECNMADPPQIIDYVSVPEELLDGDDDDE